eukprot:1178901-Prorocentrum_minimum.AAC.2
MAVPGSTATMGLGLPARVFAAQVAEFVRGARGADLQEGVELGAAGFAGEALHLELHAHPLRVALAAARREAHAEHAEGRAHPCVGAALIHLVDALPSDAHQRHRLILCVARTRAGVSRGRALVKGLLGADIFVGSKPIHRGA